ncbi:beige/beach-related [Anaeramoeba flamelloides]|uniref:Beige/beach-related n=1 Tax=Anaeramoeba flamelloides TaxID=1746091 RepID=A0AAV7Z695_9EUKA|nr:beige/beach-related [Anaeramoeba flamelloides]
MKNNNNFFELLNQQFGWQYQFFKLLNFNNNMLIDSESNDFNRLIFKFFQKYHYHYFVKNINGMNYLTDSFLILSITFPNKNLLVINIKLKLIDSLLQKIEKKVFYDYDNKHKSNGKNNKIKKSSSKEIKKLIMKNFTFDIQSFPINYYYLCLSMNQLPLLYTFKKDLSKIFLIVMSFLFECFKYTNQENLLFLLTNSINDILKKYLNYINFDLFFERVNKNQRGKKSKKKKNEMENENDYYLDSNHKFNIKSIKLNKLIDLLQKTKNKKIFHQLYQKSLFKQFFPIKKSIALKHQKKLKYLKKIKQYFWYGNSIEKQKNIFFLKIQKLIKSGNSAFRNNKRNEIIANIKTSDKWKMINKSLINETNQFTSFNNKNPTIYKIVKTENQFKVLELKKKSHFEKNSLDLFKIINEKKLNKQIKLNLIKNNNNNNNEEEINLQTEINILKNIEKEKRNYFKLIDKNIKTVNKVEIVINNKEEDEKNENLVENVIMFNNLEKKKDDETVNNQKDGHEKKKEIKYEKMNKRDKNDNIKNIDHFKNQNEKKNNIIPKNDTINTNKDGCGERGKQRAKIEKNGKKEKGDGVRKEKEKDGDGDWGEETGSEDEVGKEGVNEKGKQREKIEKNGKKGKKRDQKNKESIKKKKKGKEREKKSKKEKSKEGVRVHDGNDLKKIIQHEFKINCKLIKISKIINGKLFMNKNNIVYSFLKYKRGNQKKIYYKKNKSWKLKNISQIFKRNYQNDDTALEIFFTKRTSIFLNFDSKKTRKNILYFLKNLQSLKVNIFNKHNNLELANNNNYLKRWQNRKISNFDYLMILNKLAGRSYNDLAKWPIFPWVIKDFTSKHIDLNDHNVYRNLSTPINEIIKVEKKISMHVQLEKRNYKSKHLFKNSVLYFLYRLEPFTSLAKQLKNNPFKNQKNTFSKISFDENISLQNNTQFGESLPEFYCFSEFLKKDYYISTNYSKFPIDDIKLPPWANNSSHKFIKIMNESLESEYVSNNLHHWINIMFGYRQNELNFCKKPFKSNKNTNKNNLNKNNINSISNNFSYSNENKKKTKKDKEMEIQKEITKEEDDDEEEEEEEKEKESKELKNNNNIDFLKNGHDEDNKQKEKNEKFLIGQHLPKQLFLKPHAQRIKLKNDSSSINNWFGENNTKWGLSISKQPIIYLIMKKVDQNKREFFGFNNCIITVDLKRNLSFYKLNSISNNTNNFNHRTKNGVNIEIIGNNKGNFSDNKLIKKTKEFEIYGSIKNEDMEKIGISFDYEYYKNFNNCFGLLNDCSTFISCGYFDSNIRMTNINDPSQRKNYNFHTDTVTCLRVDVFGDYLVTGSADSSICIWKIKYPDSKAQSEKIYKEKNNFIFPKLKLISLCFGHQSPITCLAINSILNLIASVSIEGLLLIHQLKTGELIKSIVLSDGLYSKDSDGDDYCGGSGNGGIEYKHFNKNDKRGIKKKMIYFNLQISNNKEIILSSKNSLFLMTIYGDVLKRIDLQNSILTSSLTLDHKYIILAGEDGLFQIRSLLNLQLIKDLKFTNNTIHSLYITENKNQIILGLNHGSCILIKF